MDIIVLWVALFNRSNPPLPGDSLIPLEKVLAADLFTSAGMISIAE